MPGIISSTDRQLRKFEHERRLRIRRRRGNEALRAWCLAHANCGAPVEKIISQRGKDAAKRLGIDLVEPPNELRIALPERRAQAVNLNTAGGYLVAEDFASTFERALLRFSPVRELATVITTRTGAPLPWPLSNDTSNEAVILPENSQLTALDIPFGQAVLGSFKWNSRLIQVPFELMDDAADPFAEFLAATIGQRIALGQNRSFTTGSGTGGPLGLLSAAVQGAQAASQTAIAWNDLVAVMHAVDPVFRMPDMRPAWQMHDNILLAIQKLADGAGRPLLTGAENGGHFYLMGFPVITNLHMPSTMASGNRTVLFGAHAKILIRDVREVRIRHLTERYADAGQDAYCGLMRSDMVLLDAGTKPLAYLVH